MNNHQIEIKSKKDLNKTIKSNEILSDIIIRGNELEAFEGVSKVYGSVCFCDCIINSLDILKEVKKNFSISSNSVDSRITSLNHLEKIGGDLILRGSNIQNLGSLQYVGGKVSLRDTAIDDLGVLTFVGGDLFLPKRLQGKIDFTEITVKGNIKFWNDAYFESDIANENDPIESNNSYNIPQWENQYIYSFDEIFNASKEQIEFYNVYKKAFLNEQFIETNGVDNYSFILFYDLKDNICTNLEELIYQLEKLASNYSKTKHYCDLLILEKLEEAGKYEEAWLFYLKNKNLEIEKIVEYESKLKRELVNGDIILKIAGEYHFSDFGQRNVREILPFVNEKLNEYKAKNGIPLFDLFFNMGKPIRVEKRYPEDQKKSVFSYLKKKTDRINFEYDPDYYKPFFISESEFEKFRTGDIEQEKSGYIRTIPLVVEKAIEHQFRKIIRDAEDFYRESIGMPKIGEGWLSETELFYKISNYFINEEVIQHASPDWLGRQHLDVYFPKSNIGIEYQGLQHYEPIDFFGGQEAFDKTVERDERKRLLCEKNKCRLIYVQSGYDLNKLITEIEEYI